MVIRTSKYQWVAVYGPYEQIVVGTRKQAKETEETLRRLHKADVDHLPWYTRWIGRLNMWMIDIAHA